MEREILMSGIGGQGVQLAATVLARAALAEGREAMLLGSYGGTMRGGSTEASLVVASEAIATPPIVSRAWAVLLVHDRFAAPVLAKLRDGSLLFTNRDLVATPPQPPADPAAGALPAIQRFEVDATRIASEVASPVAASLVLAAAFAGATGLVGREALIEAMRASVPSYRTQHLEANERALRAGFDALAGAAPAAWPAVAGAA